MTFSISAAILQELHQYRERERARLKEILAENPASPKDNTTDEATSDDAQQRPQQQDIEHEYDAFLLDPGMGPMLYLTSRGEVLIDGRDWSGEEVRVAHEDEAIAALVVGVLKTKLSCLLELIPPPPENSITCPRCHGTRWARLHSEMKELEFVCTACSGRGWVDETLVKRVNTGYYEPIDVPDI